MSPAPVTFSANGTNAAKNTTATFTKAGAYTFQVVLTNAAGLTATSTVSVTVNATVTAVSVTPSTATVGAGATQQFSASATDQFGAALSPLPGVAWSVAAGGGGISTGGLYTAPASAGSATVAALSGGVTGTAAVTITAPPPSVLSLSLSPASVAGGSSSTGTVTLTGPAPAGGTAVNLLSDTPSLATVPAAVTVPAGATSATFTVSTFGVNLASTATISAAAGGATQTAILTITPNLSLTAAATGSNKVTLYWNGIAGASGYNVYRGTVSGGPYLLIASNVTTSDAGPGLTNAFMYSDTVGLTSGTEYFYVVWAVQSGAQAVQSNEDSAVPNASAIPWDTGDAAQIVPSMVSLLSSTMPPDDFSNPTTPDVGFLSIGGPDGVIYQGNIPTGSAPRAVASSGRYNASSNTIDYVDGTTLAAPSDGDDAINGQASAPPTGAMKPNVIQNVPVYQYPAYTPTPTGIFHKVETQPGCSGFRGIVGLPLPGDTGLVLNKSGTEQDMAYIYTGGLLFPTAGQKYRNGATLDMDIGLQLGHSDPITNPGWKPIILYKGSALESEIVDGSSPASGESVFIKGDSLDGEQMFLYTSGVLASGATTSAQSAATDNLVVLRLVGPYVYRKQITPGFNTDRSYNGAVTCTFFASGWGKFYPRNGPQAPLVPKRFIIKRCNSIAQTLNNPRTPAIFKTGRVYPNGPPGVPTNQAGFYTSGSSIIGASWGTADSQAVTVYGSSGWESWEDPQTWVDSLGLTHSGSYPALNRYVDWLDQNDFFWEVNVNLQTRP